MYEFLFKRSFWNYMDSMLSAVLVNIVFFVISMLLGYTWYYGQSLLFIRWGVPGLYLLVISQFLLIAAFQAKAAGGRTSFGIRELLHFLRKRWIRGIQLFFLLVFLTAVGTISLPFYFQLGGIAGAVGASLITWILLLSAFVLLLLCPIMIRSDAGLWASLKKAFFYVMGNPLPMLFSALMTVIMLFFSVLFLFIIPGMTALMIFSDVLIFLLDKKYDFLASNTTHKGPIPWTKLLESESGDLNRSLLDTLFPFRRK